MKDLTPENYLDLNRSAWNNKLQFHLSSEFYDLQSFLNGKSSLNDIELELLGDIKGKSILHLQCHFGQDSISLARMGAKVTGVDLSDKAIDKARELAKLSQVDAEFICSDIYSLPEVLNKKFDIVFTSYGTIGWLPDIAKWAEILSLYTKANGHFVFAEFHPFVWMYNGDFTSIDYNYFNKGPIVEVEEATYADKKAPIKQEVVGWNHSIAEVLQNILKDFHLLSFNEFDYSPYNCFKNMEELEQGKYRIAHLGDKIPMVYALKAIRK